MKAQSFKFITVTYAMALTYPEFYIGGVLDSMHAKCVQKFAATPTFIDHTHQFKADMPIISRCILSRIELTFIGLIQDVLVSGY